MGSKVKTILVVISFFSILGGYNVPFSVAADYPTKPINLYVGMVPGGATDVAVRILVAEANKYLEHPIIVNNKPGGGGAIATDFVCKAKPDGYNLNWATSGTIIQAVTNPKNPFKLADLTPIARAYQMAMVIVVRSDSQFKGLEDLVKAAKEKPGMIAAGSPGVRSIWHFALEMLSMEAGIKFRHVPFKGDAEVVTALLGGHIEVGFMGSGAALEHIKSGSFRGLAITFSNRSPNTPDVPTFAEKGYARAAIVTSGTIQGPAGLPKEVAEKISSSFEKALETPVVVKAYQNQDLLPSYMGPEELKSFFSQEEKRIHDVAQHANLISH
jgi:tripartite-type tricarboxylate transporter receptor subunit TctC